MSAAGNLKTSCGSCGAEFEFPASAAGREITCPNCRHKILLQAAANPPPGRTLSGCRKLPRTGLLVLGVLLFCGVLAAGIYLLGRKGQAAKQPGDGRPAAIAATPPIPADPAPAASVPAAPRDIDGRIRFVLADGSVANFPATDVVLLDAAEGRARFDACWAVALSNSARLVSVKAGYDAQAETNSAQLRALEERLDTVIRLADLADEGIRLARLNIKALGLSEADPSRDPKGDIAQLNNLLAKQKRNIALQEQMRTIMKGFEKQGATLAARIKTVTEEQRRWHSPRTFFAKPWTNAITQATTSSDGRFTLELPAAGSYWIAAFIPRPDEAADKDYGWLLPLSPDSDGSFELSNNNAIYLP